MRPPAVRPDPTVAEIQGLYGSFSFPEKLLQKIWLRGDFDRAGAVTTDGRAVRPLHPGKWNLLGGPDFTGARLRLGEETTRELRGDVEVHVRAADWDAHGHARDPAYDGVVLHVVLFPPDAGHVTRGGGGREIPVLALLPLLHRGLEEFAADEAVETLSHQLLARLPEELGRLLPGALAALLQQHGLARWRQKVHYAALRIRRLGWDEACHHTALEILGFRFNRAPMLRVAGRWDLGAWGGNAIDIDAIYKAETEAWSLQGVRPANHPRTRLRQYAAWTRHQPRWPAGWLRFAAELPLADPTAATRETRGRHGLVALRERIALEVCGGALGGTRLDTAVCDGLLPLLSAQTERDFSGVWHHWFPGDLPPWLTSGLRQLGYFNARVQPACHGVAQGLLGWFLEREPRT